jgi:hypothetical protein
VDYDARYTISFRTKIVAKIKAHILCALAFISVKSLCLCHIVEKYRSTIVARDDDNTGHALCSLGN